MAIRGVRTGRDGFTLIEVLIVVAIVGIVVMIAAGSFQGMMEKYRVEGETKQMFADLMDARGRAIQRNRTFHVQVNANDYKTFEDTNPAPDGNGCLYQPRVALGGEPYALAVEVIIDGGLTLETGLGAQLPGLGEAQMAKTSPGEAASEGGLDWAGGVSGIYGARQGHISIMMGDQAPWLGRARLDSLAKRLVDHIPDLPFTQMKGDPDVAATGHDPCALVTPGEATTVLGALVVSPYRSRESSILARGDGASCTYYLGKHRALILTPTWSDGVASFKMLAGATQFVGRVLSNQTAADTLDGPWDEASSGTDGTFYFVRAIG